MTKSTQHLISRSVVRRGGSIACALRALDDGGVGIALVVDEGMKLLATVTDGDIRRALLKGAQLASPLWPHVQRNFVAVSRASGRAEVLDLMRARSIEQIPITDGHGVLVGLHLLREILGACERPNRAVIMAGGMGMRLRPVTEKIPKPMIRVAGRPILERIVLHLVGYGIRDIYISVHHLGHVIKKHFGDGNRFGCTISYLHEDIPLGTGGALSLLPKYPTEPLLVMNGDLITQADIGAMFAFHAAGNFVASMAVRRFGYQVPYGCLRLRGRRIVHIEEKPLLERVVNAGIYVLNPRLLRRIPRRFYPITELFESCLARREAVGAFEIEEEWVDIGQREQLKPGIVT